jgi:protein subunit release factor A
MTLPISPYLHFIDECVVELFCGANQLCFEVPQAVKITHLPTGIEIRAYSEKSAQKNKVKALDRMKQELAKIGTVNR